MEHYVTAKELREVLATFEDDAHIYVNMPDGGCPCCGQ